MPAGVPHIENGGNEPFSSFVIMHDVTRIILLSLNCAPNKTPTAIPINICPDEQTRIANLLTETADAFLRNSEIAPLLLKAYFGRILELSRQNKRADHNQYSPSVAKLMDTLFAELANPNITIRNISEKLGYNPDNLSTRFAKEVGQTPVEYLTNLRIERARELLQNSALSIAEIAWTSGYRDQNYFARVFKKHTNQTPRNFRKPTP